MDIKGEKNMRKGHASVFYFYYFKTRNKDII